MVKGEERDRERWKMCFTVKRNDGTGEIRVGEMGE